MKLGIFFLIFIIALTVGYLSLNMHQRPVIFMATTTTEDSGILKVLIPELEKDTGLDIDVVTFGTGKVLRSAMDGNADVILVHDQISEKLFMKNGFGSERINIMQNDFVLIGPTSDPANVKATSSLIKAFQRLHRSAEPFVSRGDDSGTHKAEMRIWQAAGTDDGFNSDDYKSGNYVITGAGMGRTLNIAVEKSAYILTDRATWISFQNKGNLTILKANDPLLTNIYSILSVNAELYPHINKEKQNLILNWFKSDKSKNLINNYHYAGKQLFKSLL